MTGNRITGNEPYFIMNFKSFKQPGLAEKITQNITHLINDRLDHQTIFENRINKLVESLQQNAAGYDFLNMLAEVKTQGHIRMVMQKKEKHQYHTEAHSAEISHDTNNELQRKFDSNNLLDAIFIALAATAAAWHDIVQDLGSPKNEQASAKNFEAYLKIKLDQFSNKHPNCKKTIDQFRKELGFISREMIVYDTWLIMNDNHAQSLLQYATKAITNLPVALTPGQCMQRLIASAQAICEKDTRRFADEEIVCKKKILHKISKFSDSILNTLENFFKYAEKNNSEITIDQDEKETFLGLLGQDIRMFSELNLPHRMSAKNPMLTAKISDKDYLAFVNLMNELRRANPQYNEKINYKQLLDLFLYTVNLHDEDNIHRAIKFALSQNKELWTTHAKLLSEFDEYYKTLSDGDKNKFAFCLFAAATHFQPGITYLANDKLFLQALPETLQDIRHKINWLIHNHDLNELQIEQRLQKLTRAEKNIIDCMQRYHLSVPDAPALSMATLRR